MNILVLRVWSHYIIALAGHANARHTVGAYEMNTRILKLSRSGAKTFSSAMAKRDRINITSTNGAKSLALGNAPGYKYELEISANGAKSLAVYYTPLVLRVWSHYCIALAGHANARRTVGALEN